MIDDQDKNLKIYFSGSIRGGRQDAVLYRQLIDELKQYGTVLTEHIGNNVIEFDQTDKQIHDQDMNWLIESDLLVGEITTPSLGVGYEIGHAMAMNKRVICLYRDVDGNSVSAMIKGSPGVECYKYKTLEDAKLIIAKCNLAGV